MIALAELLVPPLVEGELIEPETIELEIRRPDALDRRLWWPVILLRGLPPSAGSCAAISG